MDWSLTLGLMAVCVLSAAVTSTTQNGFLNPHATEPFISRQLLDLAVGFGLAAAVAGWRGHPILGWSVAAYSAWLFVCGFWGLWRYNRRKPS